MRVDFVDAILGNLEQVLTIEGGASMGGNVDRAQGLARVGVEGVDFFSAGKPYLLTVPGQAMHLVDIGKRTIFTEDFGG